MTPAHFRATGSLGTRLARSPVGRSLAVGLAAVLTIGISDIPRKRAEAAPAPINDEILERPDEMAALITARMSGRKVRITGMTTDSTEYVAHPDGKIEATVHAGPVRMQRDDDGWVEIDLTLEPAGDGSVRAKAHPLNLWISGARGDGGDLARVGEGERRLTLGWPGALPTPMLAENRATYPEVEPGIDLVVEATRTGFSQYLTVKSRNAVDRLPTLDLPLAGKGLSSFVQGDSGELTLKDAKDRPIAAVPAPEMWDAQRAPGTEQPTRRALVKVRSERTKSTGARGGGGLVMRLRPDLAWLKDPATQYPVTIDPQINPLYTSFDTYVKEGDSVDRSGATDIQLGLLATTPAVKARGFVHWPVSALRGKQITAATVYFWNWWSHSCTASSWEIWTTGAASSATRWGTQPTWIQKEATSTLTKGYSSACDDGWVSISGTSFFQRAATANQATAYMGVRGTDETSTNSFKQFRSRNATSSSQVPYATVTYNSYPTVGTRSTVPATACVTGSSRPKMNTATPQLRSVISDAEASPVKAEFEWWTLTGTTKLGSVITSTAASGSTFTATVPAGVLAHGSSYKWRVRGNDGTVNGSWSSFCEFNVDTSIGGPPIVTSETYPENAWGGDANLAGQFTFEANGVEDAAAYEYSLDVLPPNRAVNTTVPGASATVSITPLTPGWHNVWVRTRDSAGNVTELRQYPFKVGSAAMTSPETGDISGAKAILSSISASSFTEVTYQWRRAGSDSWVEIPASHVSYAAGGGTFSWPVPVTGGTVPRLNWDVAATLAAVDGQGIPRDGPLQVRGYFNPNSHGAPSDPVKIRFDRDRASAATVQVGPGAVNLITGNYQLSSVDASVAGLSVTRTLNSRQPSGNADPLFGPGWTSGIVVSDAQAPYSRLNTYGSLVQVRLPDDTTIGFTKVNTAGINYEPQVGSETYKLTFNSSTNSFNLSDGEGNVVTFTRAASDPPNTYTPTAATAPGSGSATTYSWEKATVGTREVMRPTRLLAPVPAGVTCTTLVRGCRAFTFTYATTTTATGYSDGTWGDYTGRVKEISYTAWDPDLPVPAMHTVAIARYTYDSSGRLRTYADPRLDYESGGTVRQVRTVYYYNGDGIITSLTPPAQEPWHFSYTAIPDDPGKGRLYQVSRSALSAGTAVETVIYQVPTSGTGAPYNMSDTETGRWGQSEAPTDATAVFPATQVPDGDPSAGTPPTSYERAVVAYLDANARNINTAEPGGHISTTWYDQFGNVVGELTAGNRKRALDASPTDSAEDEAEIATRLADRSFYSPDGELLQETFGPEHDVMLDSGTVVRGRQHVRYTYDEGAPATGGPYKLPTTEQTTVSYVDAGQTVDADARSIVTEYDWTLRQPTKVTVDPGGLELVTRKAYDSAGRVLSETAPAGGSTDTTPATRVTVNYVTGVNATHPECGNHPEWDGMVCRVQTGGQPESGPELPVTATTYDLYGQLRVQTEKTGSGVLRTTEVHYDAAGRVSETMVSAPGLGEPLEKRRNVYDQAGGQLIRTETVNGTGNVTAQITRVFDTLGRVTSYTDTDGNVSTTAYDLAGRLSTINDGKGTRTYSYDGGNERRGLTTSVSDSQIGVFGGSYNADGYLIGQTWPNGLVVAHEVDEASTAVGITYTKPDCNQSDCTIYTESVSSSIHNQWRSRTSSLSGQTYAYDRAGRLISVRDTNSGQCVSRSYDFSEATNRMSFQEHGPDGGGACQTAATSISRNWEYDSADRLVSTGYSYDALGRNLLAPAVDSAVANGSDSSYTYYANDMVRSITHASRTSTYTLDVIANRIRSWTDASDGQARHNHYSGDSDIPTWIDEGNNQITRPIEGVSGIAGIFASINGVAWQITNLHGDFVAGMTETGSGIAYTNEYNEYGVARDPADAGSRRYGYLGSHQRAADTPDGSILMGARLYSPTTGRFRSVDPVYGGNANPYEYCVADPVNCADTSGLKRFSIRCHGKKRYPNWSCGFTAKWGYWETQSIRWYSGSAQVVSSLVGLAVGLLGGWPGVVVGALLAGLTKAHNWIKNKIPKNHCLMYTGGFGVAWFVPWAWVWPYTFRCR